ncbi:kinase-like domain-containing protein [Colletotrichum cereale]|nr:kinase-like domain-containing protein [Colletotrichum cereale]
MKPGSSSHNSEQKVVIPEIAELGSFDDEVCIEEDRQGNSKGHLSPRHNIPQVSGRVQDTPVAWKVNFTGGPDIGGNASSSSNGKKRRLSELDSVVSVYDMGLYDSQKHDLGQNEATPAEIDSSVSADRIEDSIRDKIEGKLCWSKMDQKEYLPRSAFEEIFTTATVQSLIRAIYPHAADEELARKIDQIIGDTKRSRRMIIATLVFMKQTGHIEDFIREGIYDRDMPLRHERKSMREFKTRAGPSDQSEDINTTLFQGWERVHVDLFYIYQKMIVVPIFNMDDGKLRSYVLDRDVRLPWAKFEHKTSGGHGIVHKLQIHPSHYKLEGNNKAEHPRCFAVKEIQAADHESYRNELRALEKACAKVQKEKHLIKLLLTFQHGDKPYLVFEWADGNLQEFWARKKVASVDASTRWMLQQCRGIANAVKRIHGLATWQKQGRSTGSGTEDEEDLVKDWGRHGDIKPSNILWFSTYGEDSDHLVVADLGLTRYHSRLTRSRVLRVDGFTGTYRAPEIDLGDPISSKYDIWSLGCVFLEFCIWYLLDIRAIEAFESERRSHHRLKETREPGEFDNSYFMMDVSTGRKEAVLKPAVAKVRMKLPPDDYTSKSTVANFRVISVFQT